MVSIQQTLAKIEDDRLRKNALNFNDAYNTILEEEQDKNAQITQVAQEIRDESIATLDMLKDANTKAAVAQTWLDSALAYTRATRAWLSENIAGQTLSRERQAARVALADIEAKDAAARNQQEVQLLQAKDTERQRDAWLVQNLQSSVLSATQAADLWLYSEDRAKALEVAREIRWEDRTNRLQDAQLDRDVALEQARAKASASTLDPEVARVLLEQWITVWSWAWLNIPEWFTSVVILTELFLLEIMRLVKKEL